MYNIIKSLYNPSFTGSGSAKTWIDSTSLQIDEDLTSLEWLQVYFLSSYNLLSSMHQLLLMIPAKDFM